MKVLLIIGICIAVMATILVPVFCSIEEEDIDGRDLDGNRRL